MTEPTIERELQQKAPRKVHYAGYVYLLHGIVVSILILGGVSLLSAIQMTRQLDDSVSAIRVIFMLLMVIAILGIVGASLRKSQCERHLLCYGVPVVGRVIASHVTDHHGNHFSLTYRFRHPTGTELTGIVSVNKQVYLKYIDTEAPITILCYPVYKEEHLPYLAIHAAKLDAVY
jgi:ribosomal protein L35AE/L33A